MAGRALRGEELFAAVEIPLGGDAAARQDRYRCDGEGDCQEAASRRD
jgi:hypothetical protein